MALPAGNSPRQNATVSPTQYRILAGAGPPAGSPDDWDEAAAAPSDPRRGAARRAAGHARPGRAGVLPRRRIPPRLRGDLAGPTPDDVLAPRSASATARTARRSRITGRRSPRRSALSRAGPLYAQGPGDLTRWMGLPWQADTAYCRSGYDTAYDPFVPTFWPARVPNQVLTEANYGIAIDPAQSPREAARGVHRPDGLDRPPEGADGPADGADGPSLRGHGGGGGAGGRAGRPGPPGDDEGRVVRAGGGAAGTDPNAGVDGGGPWSRAGTDERPRRSASEASTPRGRLGERRAEGAGAPPRARRPE